MIAIAGFFFDTNAVREQLMGQIEALVGNNGAEFVRTALDNANRPGQNSGLVATIVSIVLLLVGSTGVLVQLQTALNDVWDVQADPERGLSNILRKRLLSLGMILVIGFLLLVSLVISSLIAGFSTYFSTIAPGLDSLIQLLNFVVGFGVTTLLFCPNFQIRARRSHYLGRCLVRCHSHGAALFYR